MMEIKVGFLVAYDYEMLKQSLPPVYQTASKIVLAIDKNRRTFAGKEFTIDPSFFTWLNEVDAEKKITVYEEEVYQPDLSMPETETRIRNLLAKKLGEGGWHVQLDVDEYFVNMPQLAVELERIEKTAGSRKLTVMASLSSIFKITGEGYFIIGNPEKFALATNNPVYSYHRYNDEANERYTINHLLLHQSWGRDENDLKTKLKNWGHRDDFDTSAYFKFWQSIGQDNYRYIKDFHPLNPGLWHDLTFIKAGSITELLAQMPYEINATAGRERWAPFRKWLPPVVYNRLQKHLA